MDNPTTNNPINGVRPECRSFGFSDTWLITDETTGKSFRGEPFPPFRHELIAAGGLAA